MKKNFFFLFVLFAANFLISQSSEDIIVKKDGSVIKGKVTEVSETEIKYKKNNGGPVYSLSKSNILSITYSNGETEKFSSEGSDDKEKTASKKEDGSSESEEKKWWEDEEVKKYLEATAKDAGEQLVKNCATGKVDNHSTEVYWDQVVKDPITGEISIPIIAKWKPKFTDGSGKWIKGKILLSKDGSKRWVFQSSSGMVFNGCAKDFKIK